MRTHTKITAEPVVGPNAWNKKSIHCRSHLISNFDKKKNVPTIVLTGTQKAWTKISLLLPLHPTPLPSPGPKIQRHFPPPNTTPPSPPYATTVGADERSTGSPPPLPPHTVLRNREIIAVTLFARQTNSFTFYINTASICLKFFYFFFEKFEIKFWAARPNPTLSYTFTTARTFSTTEVAPVSQKRKKGVIGLQY